MNRKSLSIAAGLLLAVGVAQAATLPPALHAYGLNKTYADELGGNPLVPNGGVLKKTFYQFDIGQGLTLTDAVPGGTYSIELRFTPTNTEGYRRILDFLNGTSDSGLYILNGAADFYPIGYGPDVVFQNNKPVDVTITRNGKTKAVVVYVNGVQQLSFDDSSDLAIFTDNNGSGAFARFFEDNGSENTAGTLDHVRIFSKVLTAAQAKALAQGQLPPNVKTK